MTDETAHQVGAFYGLIWVGSYPWPATPLPAAAAGSLITPVPGGFYLHTETHTGLVEVTARAHGTAPPALERTPIGAEEVHVDVTEAGLCVSPIGGEGDVIQGLASRPGAYTVRVFAQRRVEDDEAYLLDIWPSA